MSRELLETIAYENSLEYIKTTFGQNGYPQCIRGAIIGFETFDEAQKIAKEHGLRITTFFKRDGWQFYQRDRNTTWEPMKITSYDYGDDYKHYGSDILEDFYEEEVKPFLGDMDSFDDLKTFISRMEEIYDEIGLIDESQWVITHGEQYYETIDKELMSWSNDSKTWVIGVMEEEA